MLGKHTAEGQKIKELEKIIARKDQEIKDVKTECAEQFKRIKDLCFINNCNTKYSKLNKIYEIASDNFSALVEDLVISEADEEVQKENAKIIELPNYKNKKELISNTDQSTKN